jgi:hypothetical protein
MVREARFLWSDPFEDPQRSDPEPSDDFDDLDLTPLKPRHKRRRSKPERKHPGCSEAAEVLDTPPRRPCSEGGTP